MIQEESWTSFSKALFQNTEWIWCGKITARFAKMWSRWATWNFALLNPQRDDYYSSECLSPDYVVIFTLAKALYETWEKGFVN